MVDILIFGTGVAADVLMDHYLDFEKVRILAFVNSTEGFGKEKKSYKIISVNEISGFSYDYILIAADAFDSIRKQCIDAGVPEERIVGSVYHSSPDFAGIAPRVNSEIKKMFKLDQTTGLFKRALPEVELSYYLIANELLLDRHRFTEIPCSVDPVRLNTVHALSREITLNNVEGSVAELGVFRGDFAGIINSFFPDRTFYLFDTFEGFSKIDTGYDVSENYSDPSSHFQDTSVDLVLSKMPHRDMCKIKKGYFPESTLGIDDIFSFVSIDTDLYLPVYNGLVYFYERLSHNGYILVHDFNHKYYSGAREAVMKFCRERKIGYCPISDAAGSAIITK